MPTYPKRRRQRLPGFDYSTAGAYFVTVCIHDRLPLFGHITDGRMVLSGAGEQVQRIWREIDARYPGVALDTLIVMPDHHHAVIWLRSEEHSLSDIIHHIKARSTAQYALGVHESGWPPFKGKLWQQGFYERVIRDDAELRRVREYILENLARWVLKRQRGV